METATSVGVNRWVANIVGGLLLLLTAALCLASWWGVGKLIAWLAGG